MNANETPKKAVVLAAELTPAEHQRLKIYACAKGTTLREGLTEIIRDFLAHAPKTVTFE